MSMQRVKMALFGVLLIGAVSSGATANANCCFPGSKLFFDSSGKQVGYQMIGCGDDALHGTATSNFKWVNGCVA